MIAYFINVDRLDETVGNSCFQATSTPNGQGLSMWHNKRPVGIYMDVKILVKIHAIYVIYNTPIGEENHVNWLLKTLCEILFRFRFHASLLMMFWSLVPGNGQVNKGHGSN